jgi:hypothetical protein
MSPVIRWLLAFAIKTFAVPTSVRHLANVIRLAAIGLIYLATVILLNSIANHPRFYAGLLLFGAAAGFVWRVVEAVRSLPTAVMNISSDIQRGLKKVGHFARTNTLTAWSCKQVKRLDPDLYLGTGWHEAGLLGVGIGVTNISLLVARHQQHLYVVAQHKAHLLATFADYNPPKLDIALYVVGCSAALFAFVRLSARLADQISEWWQRRRVTP